MALDDDGDFVIAWDSFIQNGVFAQRFGPSPDEDSDGIADLVEDGAPNGGDGNDDGTPDSEQVNVTSLPNAIDGQYVTLASPPGARCSSTFRASIPATLPPPPAAAGDFPIGVLSFKVTGVAPGGTIDVELFLPAGLTLSSYYKFGSEPGMPADHWYEFLDDGTTGAVLGMDLVTLTLVDGDRGDDDLAANGTIVEPGGPVSAITGNLDIDGDGEALALTDGLLCSAPSSASRALPSPAAPSTSSNARAVMRPRSRLTSPGSACSSTSTGTARPCR